MSNLAAIKAFFLSAVPKNISAKKVRDSMDLIYQDFASNQGMLNSGLIGVAEGPTLSADVDLLTQPFLVNIPFTGIPGRLYKASVVVQLPSSDIMDGRIELSTNVKDLGGSVITSHYKSKTAFDSSIGSINRTLVISETFNLSVAGNIDLAVFLSGQMEGITSANVIVMIEDIGAGTAIDLNLGPTNVAPTANSFSFTTAFETNNVTDVTSEVTNGTGTVDFNTTEITQHPANGSVTVAAGEITYTPDVGYDGPDSYSYRVQDDLGQWSNSADANITVSAVVSVAAFFEISNIAQGTRTGTLVNASTSAKTALNEDGSIDNTLPGEIIITRAKRMDRADGQDYGHNALGIEYIEKPGSRLQRLPALSNIAFPSQPANISDFTNSTNHVDRVVSKGIFTYAAALSNASASGKLLAQGSNISANTDYTVYVWMRRDDGLPPVVAASASDVNADIAMNLGGLLIYPTGNHRSVTKFGDFYCVVMAGTSAASPTAVTEKGIEHLSGMAARKYEVYSIGVVPGKHVVPLFIPTTTGTANWDADAITIPRASNWNQGYGIALARGQLMSPMPASNNGYLSLSDKAFDLMYYESDTSRCFETGGGTASVGFNLATEGGKDTLLAVVYEGSTKAIMQSIEGAAFTDNEAPYDGAFDVVGADITLAMNATRVVNYQSIKFFHGAPFDTMSLADLKQWVIDNAHAATFAAAIPGSPPVASNFSVNAAYQIAKDTDITALVTKGSANLDFSTTEVVQQPTNGTTTINGAVITYTPDNGYDGPDSFTYRVMDSALQWSNVGTASVTVNAQVGTPGAIVMRASLQRSSAGTTQLTFGLPLAIDSVSGTGFIAAEDAQGNPVAIQTDYKSSFPNGSRRHAIVSAITDKDDIILKNVAADPTTGANVVEADIDQAFTMSADIVISGVPWSASIAAASLPAKKHTWLDGPVCSEWQYIVKFKDAGSNDHPHLFATFNVRKFAGQSNMRIDFVMENNWSFIVNPQNWVYDYDIVINGSSVSSGTALDHYHHARWKQTFWTAGAEPDVHVVYDLDDLFASRAVPHYDQRIQPNSTDIQNVYNAWFATNTGPMGIGQYNPNMSSTGGRPEIGPNTKWSAFHLLAQAKLSKETMLSSADVSGTWTIHYRDDATGDPISIIDYPSASLRANDNPSPAFPPTVSGQDLTPNSKDNAHVPHFTAVAFILTGDYYYLEELQFWASNASYRQPKAWRTLEKGYLYMEQTRAQAWVVRNYASAAAFTPDSSHLKAKFETILQNNADAYTTLLVNDTNNQLGVHDLGYAIAYNGDIGVATWQDSFFTWMTGYVAGLGYTSWDAIRDWKIQFLRSMFNDATYNWNHASLYSVDIRASGSFSGFYSVNNKPNNNLYSTIAAVFNNSVPPEILGLAHNSQAMVDQYTNGPLNTSGLNYLANRDKFELVDSFLGYPTGPEGFPANMQIGAALVAEVLNNVEGDSLWSRVDNRTFPTSWGTSPQFAITPNKNP